MSRGAALLRPWSVTLLGNAVGSAFYAASKRRREVTLNNLRLAFSGEKSQREIEAIAREVFRHFSREAFQFFYLLALSREKIDAMVDVTGLERVREALAEGNGVIAVTAHYGNWELMARKFVMLGFKVNVIARDSDDPGMTGIATRIRESGGYRVFDRDLPMIGAFRVLKNNEVLGILPDQNESQGIPVEFFGRPGGNSRGSRGALPEVESAAGAGLFAPACRRTLRSGSSSAHCFYAKRRRTRGHRRTDSSHQPCDRGRSPI